MDVIFQPGEFWEYVADFVLRQALQQTTFLQRRFFQNCKICLKGPSFCWKFPFVLILECLHRLALPSLLFTFRWCDWSIYCPADKGWKKIQNLQDVISRVTQTSIFCTLPPVPAKQNHRCNTIHFCCCSKGCCWCCSNVFLLLLLLLLENILQSTVLLDPFPFPSVVIHLQ